MIDSQLSQAKEKKDNNSAMLDDLAFVIIIGDFYQLLPIVKKSLSNKGITFKKNYDRKIWNHLASIITLPKKIPQHSNKFFQEMLTRVKTDLLNNGNITVFNNKVATIMLIQDILKNVVILD